MTTARRATRNEALENLLAAAVLQLERDWSALTDAQHAVLSALRAARRRATTARSVPPTVRAALDDFTAATARFNTDAGALAERWAAVDLPRAYRLGAEDALRSAVLEPDTPRPGFAWNTTHQGVLLVLTSACYPVLLRRVADTVRRAQAFARAATTAARAEQEPLPDLGAEHPLDTVAYGNGARHPAASWARAALAAQSVTVANTGALTASTTDLEARWVEVTDGPECGWTSHPELDRAHGTLRSAEEAATYPIAHPGCLRRFIPRPDLNNAPVEEGQPI
ncbi:hypothetical protein [Streptomyces tendae]|uniref:hypothetical protein n=1 Tax=Streptomyces tendae TaxID=1932 RepID=UPI003EB9AF10